ncbi:MAG: DEAD/DEAH box helicase [Deltaproteobacteria bacterium]|nr:DEAD/DEAH box helicase [Deltaproteobacteria bacterium]
MLFARSTFDDVLSRLVAGELLPGQVTAHHERPASSARFGDFPDDLHPSLVAALRARGIDRPYAHQAEAIATIRQGRDLVLTTPTASGKTLCFNVPVLDRILREPAARALYLFPTKALSADQYAGLHGLVDRIEGADIKTYTFDGDTPSDARRSVRDHGHIVITNPDMLHAAVLPQHTKWTKLFENLRYVVIDELHTYRGIFGSNVAQLLRRLVRVCRFHGSDPRFIACSATIDNPLDLARRLIGDRADGSPRDLHLIDRSDAPRAEHHHVAYNPPVVNRQLQIRAGAVAGATAVARALLLAGVPTIVFAGSRLHVELILKYLREALVQEHVDPELVQGYRGGYLPLHRRRIETGLRAGTIRGVVATNALEVGIDIGTLQAAVIAGYPGSIASFRQQSGRAGRRAGAAGEARAMTIYVAGSQALDQYLVNRPELLFEGAPETARINPKNLFVLVDHAKCAAYELPFERGEAFGVIDASETEEVLRYLESHRILHEAAGRFHWMDRAFPANHVRLRGPNEENFIVIEIPGDRVLAEVDFRSAHTTLHDHAIYHVDSAHYQVERLDYDDHKAFVRKVDPDYYTTCMTYTKVKVLSEDGARVPAAAPAFRNVVGEVLVSRKHVGFKKIKFHTNEVIGYGEVHLPDLEMHTSAAWLEVPGAIMDGLAGGARVEGADGKAFPRDVLVDALTTIGHALRTVSCAALMCAERDLGVAVEDDAPRPDDGARAPGRGFDPTLYLYDALPGGIGLAPEIHARLGELLVQARGLGARCGCEHGCPQCAGPMPAFTPQLRAAGRALLDALCAAFASGAAGDEA